MSRPRPAPAITAALPRGCSRSSRLRFATRERGGRELGEDFGRGVVPRGPFFWHTGACGGTLVLEPGGLGVVVVIVDQHDVAAGAVEDRGGDRGPVARAAVDPHLARGYL